MPEPSSNAPLQNEAAPALLSLDTLSEWHQDQFERHLGYARSLGLSPDHALRYARQQLRVAEAVRTAPGQTPQ